MQARFAARVLCLFLLCTVAVWGEVKPSALFSDHMVLQRGMSVPVWGKADPGEAVTVTLNGQSRSTVAGQDGKWLLRLRNLKVGGPYQMQIQGKNTLTIKGEKVANENSDSKSEVLYRGIAARAFERVFQLADFVLVKNASLENGLLHVDLVREIPEAKKPRSIPILTAAPATQPVVDSTGEKAAA